MADDIGARQGIGQPAPTLALLIASQPTRHRVASNMSEGSVRRVGVLTESLILAQDERWRRA
jgi:hypothetical protein